MLLEWGKKTTMKKGGNLYGTKQKSYLGQNSGVCHSRCDLAYGDDLHPMGEDATQVGTAIGEAFSVPYGTSLTMFGIR